MNDRPDFNSYLFEALPDGGYKITGVNDKNITEAIIPEGVKAIGSKAFAFCTELTRVILPEGLAVIDEFAFSNCHKITEITIPASVSSLDNTAFLGCSDLVDIKVDPRNESYRDMDGVLYSSDGFTLISYPIGRKQRNFCIPETVAVIGSQSFSHSKYLEELTLPEDLMLIEYYAVDHLPALTRVNFNGSISDWSRIEIRNGNDKLLNARLHFTCLAPFEYCKAEDGGYEITRLINKNATELVIPYGITSIGEGAFRDCERLAEITLPHSVTNIGASAFSGCKGLRGVVIPDGVTVINDSTFAFCKSLASVVLPEGVSSIKTWAFTKCISLTAVSIPKSATEIHNLAFQGCISLNEITVAPDNTEFRDIDGSLYTKDGTTLVQYAIGKTDTEFTIPDGTTRIGSAAFSMCRSLTAITIPDSVTTVGSSAFSRCQNLTEVTVPVSVKRIEYHAFAELDSLARIIFLGDKEQWKGISLDRSDRSLTSVKITYRGEPLSKDGDMEDFDAEKVFSPFEYNELDDGYEITELKDKNATEVVIPYGVTEIGTDAFENCKALVSISLPDTVKKIGSGAFSACLILKSIRIPETVTSIGDYAFSGCSALESIAVPDSVIKIGNNAFHGCEALTLVSIGNGVTSIGEGAFDGCISLVSIAVGKDNAKYKDIDGNLYSKDEATLIRYAPGKSDTSFIIPDGVIRFGYKPFLGCTNLTSVTIPEGVTTIREYTFFRLDLQSIVIPEGVTSIGSQAFSGCSKLQSITLPQSLKRIEAEAFNNCARLSDVKYKGSKKQWKKIDIVAKLTYFSSIEKKTVKEETNTNLTKAKIHFEYKD